tara:strand:+ start:1637 stop:3190 length:1554 start_codon:yes stop_codon:yes gene_type:complete
MINIYFIKLFLSLLFLPSILFCQNQTVGLFQYNSDAYNGYTLFSPDEGTYLIDNCGKLTHSWQSNFNTGNSVYLLDDGSLLRTCRIQSTTFSGGGSGGRVEKRDWNNNLLWGYNFSNSTYHQHHDIEPLPNGNILILCWERKSFLEAINSGRDSSAIIDGELWSTYILEIEPIGSNSINIIWEWRLWDHLVQEFDSTKNNYGSVGDHPELLDINFYTGNGRKDWLHCNSIDYNENLDQIIISSRKLSEIYIIDHSTTTNEAAGHYGGISGKGGDLLYRWGNPKSYKNGTISDQKLFGQHDAHWISEDFKDGGKIMIFNNGQGRLYSSIDIISPTIDINGDYVINNNTFSPDSAEWSYTDPNPQDFYSSYISGCQRLPNGNTLICDGAHGTFFEIDSLNNKVWKYINPIINTGPIAQGDSIPSSNNGWGNATFRCTRYSPSFTGFIGKDLTPISEIEINPLPSNCEMTLSLSNKLETEEKKLLYITDILGKKINTVKKNMLLLYIYSNGYIEKKIVID